ncbi:hypothetical protein NKR23_g11301 [Pleurostoma richardsiae]|uniref:NADP-dependent oxidoreductase domain-containing protein n=1 Tax=Pleurostoma richardsiae TaxID=41990 RepID=A0AA38VBI3_9PEZI|nr:hypothetical protein NKR23_g11301 [Pleurostoma richardsiae]
MDALHALVQQGKVMYLGISNAPAWVVSAANTYARDRGRTPFAVYQGPWNPLQRDVEREVLPMARRFGLAFMAYTPLAAGKLRAAGEVQAAKTRGEGHHVFRLGQTEQTEDEARASAALEEVGRELGGRSVAAVALAYLLAKAPYVFPVVGGRKTEQLADNITALDVRLSAEQVARIEAAKPFDEGFPASAAGVDPAVSGVLSIGLVASGKVDVVRAQKPIGYD